MWILMLIIGCVDPLITEVNLGGTLTESRGSDATPVESGTVATISLWGDEYDCASTDEQGVFSVQAPASSSFFVQTQSPGRVATTFTGWSGIDDQDLEPGVLWVRGQDELDAIQTEFNGCDRTVDEGASIEGEIRVYLPVEDSVDTLPLITTASVTFEDEDGNVTEACYLDDKGLGDPSADVTGETGRFALFGLNAGIGLLTVSYAVTDDLEQVSEYLVLLPENGTAPMYPLLVDLP